MSPIDNILELNNFGLQIPGAKLLLVNNSPYFQVPAFWFGQQDYCHFTIRMHNRRYNRAVAKLSVSGKLQGEFVIAPRSDVTLINDVDQTGKYTLYLPGTNRAAQAGVSVGDEKNGLIEIEFHEELRPRREPIQQLEGFTAKGGGASASYSTRGAGGQSISMNYDDMEYESYSVGASKGMAEVGVGLQGQATQNFQTVSRFPVDFTSMTTLVARIVVEKDDSNTPKPLKDRSYNYPPKV